MGYASHDTAKLIIREYKDDIEAIKNNINESLQNNQSGCISIVFKLMNGKTVPIICFNNTPLFHVFLLLVDKTQDVYYSKLDQLKMYYNAIDITHCFNKDSNRDVSSLNFTSCNPVIHINN